ncbi:uncharacterized protein SCHCODRAFT_02088345 [Schizophyllum commune H4-8]|nr:uncharacterized protein SCHCODRAFT_02088345 [Schizophyllum commune H4-8]KAI5887085.1 hypothetical protein SCHCODRAFT_02088345 [Schizophyllum commune H4-8]
MEAPSDPMAPSRSDKYFYANGDCYVKVHEIIYRIHLYHLRLPTIFFDPLLHFQEDGTTLAIGTVGSCEQNPLTLEGISKHDFEALLWFFYESQYSWRCGVAHDTAVWESILLLAEKYAMPMVAQVACRALGLAEALDDVRRVVLAQKFGLGGDWVIDSLQRVVTREQPISDEEAMLLGSKMTATLARSREGILTGRAPCPGSFCHVVSNRRNISLALKIALEVALQACLNTKERLRLRKTRARQSGDIFLKVENTIFRLHSHLLARSSDVFSAMLSLPCDGTTLREGTHEGNAITLPGVRVADFKALLAFFYDGPYIFGRSLKSLPSTISESALHLAERFDMNDVGKMAVYLLCEHSCLGDVRRISLSIKYDLDKTSLLAQLKNVCRRSDGLSVEEGCDVGLVMSLLIARAREALTKRAYAARRKLEATDEEAEEVVKEVILAAYSS